MTSIPFSFDRLITAAASLLLFLAPILAGGLSGPEGGAIAAAALLLAAFRFVASWRRRELLVLSPVVAALWLFAALQLFSLITSVNRDLTLKSCGLTLAAAALALLTSTPFSSASKPAGVSGRQNGESWRLLCAAAAVVACLLWESVAGLQEYIVNVRSDPSSRVFATFFNPDTTAGFFAMALPICLSCLWLDLPAIPTFLIALTSFLGFITLTLTASKGGALALIIGLGVMSLFQRRLWRRSSPFVRWRLVGVYVTGSLAAFASAHVLFSRIAAAGGAQANSALFRKLVWKSALRMMLHRPFTGFGAGAFGQAYNRYAVAGPTQMAHNSYLQAGAESGVLALLVLAGATMLPLVLGLRRSARENHRNGDVPVGSGISAEQILLPGIAAGLTTAIIHNMIDFDWSIPGMWLLFWGLAGLLCAGEPHSGPPSTGSSLPKRSLRLQGAPLLLIGMGHILLAGGGVLTAGAAYYVGLAQAALGREIPPPPQIDPEKAGALASTAIALDPLDGSLRLLRGEALFGVARSSPDPSARENLLDEARDDFEAAARLMPVSAAPLYPLGALWKGRGDLPSAASAYRQALQRDPHAMGAAINLADAETLLHHPAEARRALQIVADIEDTPFAKVRGVPEVFDSHYALAWAGLARVDASSGRWSEAKAEAEHALKDLDDYAKLAKQFIRLEGVMAMYAPPGRAEMKDLEYKAAETLKQALSHLGQTSRIPEVQRRQQEFDKALDTLVDPK